MNANVLPNRRIVMKSENQIDVKGNASISKPNRPPIPVRGNIHINPILIRDLKRKIDCLQEEKSEWVNSKVKANAFNAMNLRKEECDVRWKHHITKCRKDRTDFMNSIKELEENIESLIIKRDGLVGQLAAAKSESQQALSVLKSEKGQMVIKLRNLTSKY